MRGVSDKSERVIVIDKMKIISAIIILVMCALMLIGVVKLIRGFMRVSAFDVTGDSPYESEDIVNASGIRPGDKLYSIDAEEAERRIMASCPYVTEVEIRCRFPNTVRIRVASLTASWYVAIAGDYYALDSELRVLEETSDNQKFINGGIPRITLPHIKSAVVGEPLVFGDSESEIKYAHDFMDMVKQTSFKSRLTLVDIERRFDIYIQVDGSFNVYMGSATDIASKLDAIEKALSDPLLDNCVSAEINIVDESNGTGVSKYRYDIRPVRDYGDPSEGGTSEPKPLG